MVELLSRLSSLLDNLTGTQGSLGYFAILVVIVGGYIYTSASMFTANKLETKDEEKEEEPAEPVRNFTAKQLQYFDGKKDEKNGEDKPVYLSINGIVFDVSDGRGFYGPEGPYEKFAGRECGACLAKMSFDEVLLGDLDACLTLNFGEKQELESWIDKFTHYRCYPVKGRFIPDSRLPNADRIVGIDELSKSNGSGTVPDGYAAAPIYVGAGERVYDMSFGGVTFYGPGGPYHKFAGKDASRALAKMSLDDEDLFTAEVNDLTKKQHEILHDWIKTFGERKLYPIVGRLKK